MSWKDGPRLEDSLIAQVAEEFAEFAQQGRDGLERGMHELERRERARNRMAEKRPFPVTVLRTCPECGAVFADVVHKSPPSPPRVYDTACCAKRARNRRHRQRKLPEARACA